MNDSRVHTSTASVVVLPEQPDPDSKISASDLRIDSFRASGAGGQHVNTTDSAVRITHIPTGTVVSVQDERSQHQNRAKAMRILASRVLEAERKTQELERYANRTSQIGTGDRSARIRTYNYEQNRITDHRVGLSLFGIDQMLRGEHLEQFIDELFLKQQSQLFCDL